MRKLAALIKRDRFCWCKNALVEKVAVVAFLPIVALLIVTIVDASFCHVQLDFNFVWNARSAFRCIGWRLDDGERRFDRPLRSSASIAVAFITSIRLASIDKNRSARDLRLSDLTSSRALPK